MGYDKDLQTYLSLRIDHHLKRRIRRLSKTYSVSMSEVVRRGIDAYEKSIRKMEER